MLPHILPRPQVLEPLSGKAPLITSYDLDALASAFSEWAPGASTRLAAFAAELAVVEEGIEYVDGDDSEWEEAEELDNFAMTAALKDHLAPESFTLTLNAEELTIEAPDSRGALYAVNALIQALRTPGVTAFRAESSPKHPVRGFSFDITRHFFNAEEICRVIELLSEYNVNRLHLHLSDDQGWRIEIDNRPELTLKASSNDASGGAGGFLTFDDYERIQVHAGLFGLEVVPEIDLPGHTNALLVAYPEATPDGEPRKPYAGIEVGFSWVNLEGEATWEILEDIVSSLAKRTHSDYFHIGGDEVHKVERPDYEKFIARLGKLVTKHGKKVVGWHEIAGSELPQDSQVQFWTATFNTDNVAKLASSPDIEFIASPAPHAYLDLKPVEDFPLGLTWAGLVDLKAAYDWEPSEEIPVSAERIVGVEACIWTETIKTFDDLTTMIFPRLTGIASVAWGSPRIFDEYTSALESHGRAWSAKGITFYEAPEVNWN